MADLGQWSSGQAAYPCESVRLKASGSESFFQPWDVEGEFPSEKWVASLRYTSPLPFPVSTSLICPELEKIKNPLAI